MAQATWEKTNVEALPITRSSSDRLKFLAGGLLILAAVGYLIIAGTTSSARYFITVEDLVTDPQYVGQTVRITGAVVGETIDYNGSELILDFNIAHIPEETDNMAEALYFAANNPEAMQIPVHIKNEVKPDLLKHEAQAILTGTLGEDGVFYATELLLKCPSRYEESAPGEALKTDPQLQ